MVASPSGVRAQSARWTVELLGGAAVNAPMPLRIRQRGTPDLRFLARYETRPWEGAPYYAYRVGRWSQGERAWELELVHHKLYLADPPSEVQRFEITHGFNLLLLNRAVRRSGVVLRAGAGLVVAHPESIVRGRVLASNGGGLGGGYHLAGPAVQLAVARRIRLGGGWALTVEGKATGAYARVPVAGGRATVANVAAHGLAGVAYAWR